MFCRINVLVSCLFHEGDYYYCKFITLTLEQKLMTVNLTVFLCDPEDGGDIFLGNVGLSPSYTARSPYSS
jgi:hypothetical protein